MDSGNAALSLVEALILELKADGLLMPDRIEAIYDKALSLAQARVEASRGNIPPPQLTPISRTRQ